MVDVIIELCCNIFSVTLWIFQSNAAEKMDSISYTTDENTAKRRHIHMVLYCDRGDKDGFGNHYNSVVSQKEEPGLIVHRYSARHFFRAIFPRGCINTSSITFISK